MENNLTVTKYATIYIMGASCALMDKVRSSVNSWAKGDEAICMTIEVAQEIEELQPLLKELNSPFSARGGDVILSM